MNSKIDIPLDRLNEPGNIWIRPQNGQLRYSTDANKPSSWVSPLPTYKANREIKFGQPVSLADYNQEHSIIDNSLREKTLMPTNSMNNISSIGVAVEYGNKDDFIHVQNNGELVYELNKRTNDKYWLPSHHKDEKNNYIFDWTDKDVGSTVYVAGDGSLTLNVDEVSGGNIISIGKLVFAPSSKETKIDQQKLIIHLQAGGDDRGVKNTAQFTIQMANSGEVSSIDSKYDQLVFIKLNKEGLGEVITSDEDITKDMNSSPIGAVLVKSIDGICDFTSLYGNKVTVLRMGLISGNFGFDPSNIGRIGLLNNGRVGFKPAEDYSINVGIFKAINKDTQDFLVDCRYPLEAAKSGEKIGTIKPVFGPNDEPLLDVGFALVDDKIHRVIFLIGDSVDTSKVDWKDLITSCYSKDIFEFGRKKNGKYIFSRYLEEPTPGISWSADIYDSADTWGIFNPDTFFKFRNLYYTIGNSSDGNIKQVACQIKITLDSANIEDECIWPEEAFKITLKADSDDQNYVLGGKGSNSTLFCNISRLVKIGNYMDNNGSNIETYDITVKSNSTGQLLSPGFYQNSDGKWCGFEWYLYEKNGATYLYMGTIPPGKEAKECNGICITSAGKKMSTSDKSEVLTVTVRRRPMMYNAVYLNQYSLNNPWTPYIDGNTGNLITENAIYFGSPEKMLSDNQYNNGDIATSGKNFNESGRNGKLEITTEDSGKVINLTTQVRGSTDYPLFKDKKQVIKSGGSISNSIEWQYDFSNMVVSLSAYFAPILISKDSSKDSIGFENLNYIDEEGDPISTSNYESYLHGNNISAAEILDSYIFRNIKYSSDNKTSKPTISIAIGDENQSSRHIFSSDNIKSNIYSSDKDTLNKYKKAFYVSDKYINYMSFLSLIGLSSKENYNNILKLERIIYGADFNKNVKNTIEFNDNSIDYINNIGLLRSAGYLNKSLVLMDINDLDKKGLDASYIPYNGGYSSIIDRLIIDNFYDYSSIKGLKSSYSDYASKSFNERLDIIKNITQQKGSNLAQLYIAYKDLGISEYSYDVYDFFKFKNSDNSYDIKNNGIHAGSYIEANNIIFVKNTKGYSSLCIDKEGYHYNNLRTDSNGTNTYFEICNDDFKENETYYENNASKEYLEVKLNKDIYKKNKYYVKRTRPAEQRGYPFRWPLYKDDSFNDMDFEYNFFSKSTYGLDDSLSIYDDNDSGLLSSFSSQSLEGITFDTISKLSFLYSCFDKNHTFDSRMTWFLPFIVDNYDKEYKYELKRLSDTRSIKAQDGKIYSAFLMRDNKVAELGSLYIESTKSIFMESNLFEKTANTYSEYYNSFITSNWKKKAIEDRQTHNGIRPSDGINLKFVLKNNTTYEYTIREDEDLFKKIIFLMSQGKLQRIKELLEKDPHNAYKKYGDFFAKDYIRSINISTEDGVKQAIDSINNYIHIGLSGSDLKTLSKFEADPLSFGPVNDYLKLGSYGTLISEIKSIRNIEDIDRSDVEKLFSIFSIYEPPVNGSKENINGDNDYRIYERLKRDIDLGDTYEESTLESSVTFSQLTISRNNSDVCKHHNNITYDIVKQKGTYTTHGLYTIYNMRFLSYEYKKVSNMPSNCPICIQESNDNEIKYKNIKFLPSGVPDMNDKALGSFEYDSISQTSYAVDESGKLSTIYPTEYVQLNAYKNDHFSNDENIAFSPDIDNSYIFYARCKRALDKGYTVNDIINYYNTEFYIDVPITIDGLRWEDYSLVDYSRLVAYGSKNIVYYSLNTFREFNPIYSDYNISYDPLEDIQIRSRDANDISQSFENAAIKVYWPKEINVNGQSQESLASSNNDINKYIDRSISDSTSKDGDSGIINIKPNQVTRLSTIDESNIPDITVGEYTLILKGDEDTCKKYEIDSGLIKDLNIDTDNYISAVNDFNLKTYSFSDTNVYDLYHYYDLQKTQIKTYVMPTTKVCDIKDYIIIYDLVKQGLSYEEAKMFAYALTLRGFTGTSSSLEHTYGLLNSSYFGTPIYEMDKYHGSRLEGLVIHENYTETTMNVKDLKLKEIYDFNNIDKVVTATDSNGSPIAYEIAIKRLSVIKDYIELLFSHSDKLIKDVSIVSKKETFPLQGTIYTEDIFNADETKDLIGDFGTAIGKAMTDAKYSHKIDLTDFYNNGVQVIINEMINLSNIVNNDKTKVSVRNNLEEAGRKIKAFVESYNSDSITSVGNFVSGIKDNISSIKLSKTPNIHGHNIEKYNSAYNRRSSVGPSEVYYQYRDLIPEYGYLYKRPTDIISIQKKVNTYNKNGENYHNEVRTYIKSVPIDGVPLHSDMFIGEKVLLSNGAYIHGEQLPVPQVSMNLKSDLVMQSQKLGFAPTYGDYENNSSFNNSYSNNCTAKSISLSGNFPSIEIGSQKFKITAIKKVIVDGPIFDNLPNGLKLVPTKKVRYNISYKTLSGEEREDVYPYDVFFSGEKIYRNSLYNITITDDTTGGTLKLFSGNSADLTTGDSGIKDYQWDHNKSIYNIDLNNVQDSGLERIVPIDEDLLNDIINNSNIFVAENNAEFGSSGDSTTINVDIDYGSVEEAKENLPKSKEFKHISNYDFKVVWEN